MTQEQREKEWYKDIIRDMELGEPLNSVHAGYLKQYVAQLHRRIEKAYDNGFKDGQKHNPQIQAYLEAKKGSV